MYHRPSRRRQRLRTSPGPAVDELWDAQAPFTVALVDLDNLKYANDAFGHDEGNHYILTVAELLRACCREGDGSGAYRIGGDEFVLISPRDTESSLASRLEKARDELVEKSTATEPMTFSFSYGCSKVHPDEGGSRKDITADADRKMYRYKLAHRSAQQRMRNVPGAAAARGGDFNARFFTERVFEALAMAVPGRYQFVIDIESDRSRWSANAVTDLGIPSANLENTTKVWGEHVHADDLSAYLEGAGELLQGKTPPSRRPVPRPRRGGLLHGLRVPRLPPGRERGRRHPFAHRRRHHEPEHSREHRPGHGAGRHPLAHGRRRRLPLRPRQLRAFGNQGRRRRRDQRGARLRGGRPRAEPALGPPALGPARPRPRVPCPRLRVRRAAPGGLRPARQASQVRGRGASGIHALRRGLPRPRRSATAPHPERPRPAAPRGGEYPWPCGRWPGRRPERLPGRRRARAEPPRRGLGPGAHGWREAPGPP